MFGFGDGISHEVRRKAGKYIRAIVRPQNRAAHRQLCYSILGSRRVNYSTVNIHLTNFRGHEERSRVADSTDGSSWDAIAASDRRREDRTYTKVLMSFSAATRAKSVYVFFDSCAMMRAKDGHIWAPRTLKKWSRPTHIQGKATVGAPYGLAPGNSPFARTRSWINICTRGDGVESCDLSNSVGGEDRGKRSLCQEMGTRTLLAGKRGKRLGKACLKDRWSAGDRLLR